MSNILKIFKFKLLGGFGVNKNKALSDDSLEQVARGQYTKTVITETGKYGNQY